MSLRLVTDTRSEPDDAGWVLRCQQWNDGSERRWIERVIAEGVIERRYADGEVREAALLGDVSVKDPR